MKISSSYPVILTQQVSDTAKFYIDSFGFVSTFESDWYVSLKNDQSGHSFELAILDAAHSTIPEGYRQPTTGLILNFEVENVDAEYNRLIVQSRLPLHLDIRDEAFGQRHFITSDPNGVLLDIITVIPPTEAFSSQYADHP
ncbi:VOC family protein [Brevibacillus choshinensis]|uniref:Glyoxalase/bleomycin resistance/extradiol dioxygenase family protein n=1 Tax=Brevibacillus choshinensis TaxID=54911 RepID=A0ABX7FJX8_BRECH|nr:VOC family protein [Brevibacillus choshinensis]QRG66529.1 glyoxalase/bleomycin resistance/extradiol dioxygenase family protein [Brevibacillus choshinensis]